MTSTTQLLREGRIREIWKRYCGYLDLSLEEFMEIQKRLLLEQIDLLGKCELGKKVMEGHVPTSVGEFRKKIPLTTYREVQSFVDERNEAALPVKPKVWVHTTGKYGSFKWVPYTRKMYCNLGRYSFAALVLATCHSREDFRLQEKDAVLYLAAPPPYFSGVIARAIQEEFNLTFVPPLDEAEKMEYTERIKEGFRMSLKTGIDVFYGISSVLVGVGRQFGQKSSQAQLSADLRNPAVVSRISRARLKSKLAKRAMLPKDVWKLKGVASGGTDMEIFRDQVKQFWGVEPLEVYGGTEMGVLAMESWDRTGMTFVPDVDFLEFVTEDDSMRSRADGKYQPKTLLLNELKPGNNYELVITNFQGGAYVRYRTGDLIRVISRSNKELNIGLPQIKFHSRVNDVIDLAGFTRLTEKTLWQALEQCQIKYTDWMVRKERGETSPILHFYIELVDSHYDEGKITTEIHENLKKLHSAYQDLEEMVGIKPVRITVLAPGTFKSYTGERIASGADLAHYKPPRMNPPDQAIAKVLSLSGKLSSERTK